jgi:AcrR family transcriptional regulator
MAVQQRSRDAILAGAKIVVGEVGSYESNMVDISARAQVSRATVYNHFADKEEMMLSLVESELNRLADLAKSQATAQAGLYALSRAISTDPALAKMVQTDPQDIAKFVTATNHPLWELANELCAKVFGVDNGGLVLHWLISQIGSPLNEAQSEHQAQQLARALA